MTDDVQHYLETADVWQVLHLIAMEFKTDASSTACFDRRLVQRAIELADNPPVDEVAAVKSDEDIVLRFRSLAQALEPHMPDATDRERRSRVVTMFLRAAIQSLVAHAGPNPKAVSYVIGQESGAAVAAEIERLQARHTNN